MSVCMPLPFSFQCKIDCMHAEGLAWILSIILYSLCQWSEYMGNSDKSLARSAYSQPITDARPG